MSVDILTDEDKPHNGIAFDERIIQVLVPLRFHNVGKRLRYTIEHTYCRRRELKIVGVDIYEDMYSHSAFETIQLF